MSTEATLSEAVGEWAEGFEFQRLPAEVKLGAKKSVVNAIGVAIGGFSHPDSQRAIAVAKAEGDGESTLMVDGGRAPLSQALFANAVLYNVLTQEDQHSESAMHPSEISVPLAIGVGERLHLSGAEVLSAVTVATETMSALASLDFVPYPPFKYAEAAAVWGHLGAAAGAGVALGLDRRQIAHAVGIVANLAGGLMQCFFDGTSEFHFAVANAAPEGYKAAALAAHGATAAPRALEGERGFYALVGRCEPEAMADATEQLSARLGSRWAIDELVYKPYPAMIYLMSLIDGAKEIRQRRGVAPEEIVEIRILVNENSAGAGALNTGPYESRDVIVVAAAFLVACMLRRGHVEVSDVEDYEAPEVMELVAKTTVALSPDGRNQSLEVITARGSFGFDEAHDARSYELDFDQVVEIYRGAIGETIPAAQADELLAVLRELDSVDDVAADLIPLLVRG